MNRFATVDDLLYMIRYIIITYICYALQITAIEIISKVTYTTLISTLRAYYNIEFISNFKPQINMLFFFLAST